MSKSNNCELKNLSAETIRTGILNKDFTTKEIVENSLNLIDKTKDLNSYISTMNDKALEKAKNIDDNLEANKELPLLGVPIAVKDVILAKDHKATCGSKMLENFIAPYNSTVVEKLEKAGAIIVGKSNLDEFCMGSSGEHSYFGATKNPWDKTCVPGGTSSGSASAVASGTTPISLGTDTGGSIRQPASYCGLIGLKPTYGRVSRYGVIAYASSLDQVGCFSRTTLDCANLLNVISGFDGKDGTSVNKTNWDFHKSINEFPSKLKIGLPKQYFEKDGLQEEVKICLEKCIDFYKKNGCEFIEVDLPNTEIALSVYYIIAPAEAASNLSRYDGIRYGYRDETATTLEDIYTNSRSAGFGDEVKRRILIGNYVLSSGYYDAYYGKAQKIRALVKRDFKNVFNEGRDKVDLILTPTAPTTAFKIGECENDPIKMYLNDIFTIPASLAGLPGISFPIGEDNKGLPIGAQFIGNYWQEGLILKAVNKYENEINWKKLPNEYQ